ncbi:MAG: NAD(P)-dependent oxidoreductase [Gammaproteobacteria bacterium]|nr:NAD(P)-dependent oxidoreductase [Gammaproteobacteria bacterium]
MKVLVTGATGFTGKALVRRLIDDGHRVVALDYKEGYKTDEIRGWGAEVVIGSVTDRAIVDSCMDSVEVVQHLAAAFREMNVPDSYYDEVNVGGTRTVLEAAHAHGVRKLIYCSTCGVHGNVENPPADEDAPIKPADYYQRTKYQAEPIVAEFTSRGLNTTTVRPAAIYGPGDPERFFLIFKRVARGWFPMYGNGKTLYHPVYIDNLVDALVLAMDDNRGNGRAFLIADEEYVEIEDLVKRVARAMNREVRIPHFPVLPLVAAGHVCEKLWRPFGVAPPIFPRRVDWYRQNRAFNIDRARRELGYQPKVGLDDGLRRTYEWYRREGFVA